MKLLSILINYIGTKIQKFQQLIGKKLRIMKF